MCESGDARYGQMRQDILNSFEVVTRPPEYYTQFLYVKGVQVKAHKSVDPAALLAAGEIIDVMCPAGRTFLGA